MKRRRPTLDGVAIFKNYLPKLVYAALVAVAAWSALANAIVGITRIKNPALALSLSPDDPKALAAMADAELLKFARGQRSARLALLIQDTATQSLRGEAVNARAMREAGVISDIEAGARRRTAARLRLANTLSRRDLPTNLWFIENAVLRQDIASALNYYDFALRTNEASQNQLFSALTYALGESEVREAFAPYIRARPPWLSDFLTYAIANIERPEDIADLVRLGGGIPNGREFETLEPALIGRMIETLEFDSAKNFYLLLPGTRRSLLTSLAMTLETTDPRKFPLTWGGMRAATVDGAFGAIGSGVKQSLIGSATSGERGLIARKLLFLAPGDYEVRADRDTSAMGVDSLATISATCVTRSGVRQIWSGDLKSTIGFHILKVPAECPAQFFDIILDGGSGQMGAEITIRAMSIQKL